MPLTATAVAIERLRESLSSFNVQPSLAREHEAAQHPAR